MNLCPLENAFQETFNGDLTLEANCSTAIDHLQDCSECQKKLKKIISENIKIKKVKKNIPIDIIVVSFFTALILLLLIFLTVPCMKKML